MRRAIDTPKFALWQRHDEFLCYSTIYHRKNRSQDESEACPCRSPALLLRTFQAACSGLHQRRCTWRLPFYVARWIMTHKIHTLSPTTRKLWIYVTFFYHLSVECNRGSQYWKPPWQLHWLYLFAHLHRQELKFAEDHRGWDQRHRKKSLLSAECWHGHMILGRMMRDGVFNKLKFMNLACVRCSIRFRSYNEAFLADLQNHSAEPSIVPSHIQRLFKSDLVPEVTYIQKSPWLCYDDFCWRKPRTNSTTPVCTTHTLVIWMRAFFQVFDYKSGSCALVGLTPIP